MMPPGVSRLQLREEKQSAPPDVGWCEKRFALILICDKTGAWIFLANRSGRDGKPDGCSGFSDWQCSL